ncbi:zinc finger B-box domain-containing protein 1 isoform X1 [Manis javanica]|uniref:zinc finger B-box domain-containing protein 1 isoform X1 n=1 Tax=Manis javanica TaxID=9974 RepID=UPI003C6D46AF
MAIMNMKDFVVLPWGKPGNSVKLKYKNARELRMEKVQLELENQEMEKKLQEFQSKRSNSKEERESNGYHWKSGQMGKLGNRSQVMSQNKGNVIKLSSGKVKLKLLKEQLEEPVKQPLNFKMANCSEHGKPKIKGKVCGQCENKAALLVCLECGEDYCSGCFAKIHQKGALKLHRTTLLQTKLQISSNVLDVAHRFIKEVTPDELKEEIHSTKEISKSQHKPKSLLQGRRSEVEVSTTKKAECTNPRDRPLCEGTFDEEASAQSFQEVLSQWRTGHNNDNEKLKLHASKPDSLEECEVQTNLKIWREPLTIEFKEDSLSYMEKLWLKKHRRTPQEQLQNMLPDTFISQCQTTCEAHCSRNENDEDIDAEETKVEHPALFLPVEELNIERLEPSLTIVELDDTFEEEFEEPDVVPYKVELADVDADDQQSCTFHHYESPFLYESDIYQHQAFTKGKIDLLHLHLSNSSSDFKDNSRAGTSNTKSDNIVDPDVYFPAIEKLGKSSFSERNFKEKNIGMGSNQTCNDSYITLENNDSLPSIDLEKLSLEENISQDTKESLGFNDLHERANFEDSKTIESPQLLQEIALRSKPITEQYQGLERFFVFDNNERLKLLPSHSLECSYSSTRITTAGNREWIPDHSVSTSADNAVAMGAVQSAPTPPSSRTQQKIGQTSQRPSTANLPLSNTAERSPSCLTSSHPRSRSAVARSLSRAASEISEIEYIDTTDYNEPFLDGTADQQTLDSLEKELNVLKNLADPSVKLYSLISEELPAFSNHSLNISQTTLDLLKTSCVKCPHGVEEWSSSEKDTEIQSLLTLSESSTDEEEEDFLDRQKVTRLPWSKST